MRTAAVAVLLVVGAAFASLAVGGAASATCPTPNPSQTSSSVGVQIVGPTDTPTPTPASTCTPGATTTPGAAPTPGSTTGTTTDGSPGSGTSGSGTAGSGTGSSGGIVSSGTGGNTQAHHAKPAAKNTPQAAAAGAAGAPTPGYQPVSKADPLTVTPAEARAGQKVLVAAAGFAAGEKVQLVLYPSPLIIGSYLADSTGGFRVTLTVPVQTMTGPHTIEATGWVSHHAANGRLLIISGVEAGSASSVGWIIAVGGLLLLLIVVTVFVFRSSIARMFTPPRIPEPVS